MSNNPFFCKEIKKSYQAVIIAVFVLAMNSTLSVSVAIVDDDADVGEALQ